VNNTAPIHAFEMEQAAIGAILVYGAQAVAQVTDHVSMGDFAEEIHRQIFHVASDLAAEGKLANLIAVKPYLADRIGDQPMGAYLAALAAGASTPASLVDYARAIREFADRRRLGELGLELQTRAAAGVVSDKPSIIAGEFIAAADSIAISAVPSALRRTSIGSGARNAYAKAMDRKDGKPSRGVQTGLAQVDDLIGSLEPGDTSVLAGRSSMGKTALAVQIAFNVAESGVGVAFVSLEMNAARLSERMLALVADRNGVQVAYSRIGQGKFDSRQASALDRASFVLDSLPIEIEQQQGLSTSQIITKVRQVKQMFEARGLRLGLVIVDHVGKVGASRRYSGNRVYEIGEISAGLRSMAQQLDTHVCLLAQINRAVETRENKRPMLSDLRESGSLEQDADIVFGAYREAYYLGRSGDPDDEARMLSVENDMELSVLKNRNGPIGTAHLWAEMATNTIRSGGAPSAPPIRPQLRAVPFTGARRPQASARPVTVGDYD
jgi:replicative DNA helicase